jgi:hypothetical protein
MNPRVGSRMQQACESSVEQTVRVVRTHEGGTHGVPGSTSSKQGLGLAGVDTGDDVDGGEFFEATLRKALGNRPSDTRCVSDSGVRETTAGSASALHDHGP